MNKLRVYFVLLFTLGIFCISTSISRAQEPPIQTEQTEIDKLIEEACIDNQVGAIFSYSYFIKVSYESKKDFGFGKKFTKVYEAIVPSRYTLSKTYTHPLVLIEDSRKSISQEYIAYSRKKLSEELERAESTEDKPGEKVENPTGGYWTARLRSNRLQAIVDILKTVKAAQFTNLQRKQVNGRETITIDFSPNPNAEIQPVLDYTKKIEGRIWIDKETKRIIRVEGFYLGTFKDVRDKNDAEREEQSILLFIQTKVPEGFWFPKIARLNFMKHPEIFEPIKTEFSFTNYKKSTVDIKVVGAPLEQSKDKTTPSGKDIQHEAN